MITDSLTGENGNPFDAILAEMKQVKTEYDQKMAVLQSRLQQAVQGAIMMHQNPPDALENNVPK